jgi:malate dehydrogenase (oxaloacetate-decarboxylating)
VAVGSLGARSVEVPDRAALAMAYTPGVARVCSAIADQPELAAEYTWTGNTVAVVSDGTAVLGLGDISPAVAAAVAAQARADGVARR